MLKVIAAAIALLMPAAVLAQQQQSVTLQGNPNVAPLDCSGTITTGGTAQPMFPASPAVHGFCLQNIDTTEPLWYSFTGTAAASTAASYPLATATATTFASSPPFCTPLGLGINTAPSVVATTTGHKYSCTKW
jgi:hypothetical protein